MAISKRWSWSSSFGVLFQLALFRLVIAGNHPLSIVHKDVVILGGGASGTHAAVRLREDYGKTVLLIEMEPVLVWRHTNTYTNPSTGKAFNYGVQSYIDYKGAKAFFHRFNIPLQGDVLSSSNTTFVDPDTGKITTNNTPPPSQNETTTALQKYREIIAPWDDFQLPGFWNFPRGDKIPADLLIPFTDFVRKYNLEAIAPVGVQVGVSITSTRLTLYIVRILGPTLVDGFLQKSFFDPVPFDLSLLYRAAGHLLGDDVVLNSVVVEADGSGLGVKVVVENLLTGDETVVFAKRLLVASPPSTNNLGVLGLDKKEKAVFDTWSFITIYTAVVKTNLIPDDTSVSFTGLINSTYSFNLAWNGVPGYFWVVFFSAKPLSKEGATQVMSAEMARLYEGGAFKPVDGSGAPSSEVVSISNHSQVTWGQSVEQIKAGFVQDLYALQGHRDTWYTGGLWCPDYSSHVWAFTDTLLRRLLKGL